MSEGSSKQSTSPHLLLGNRRLAVVAVLAVVALFLMAQVAGGSVVYLLPLLQHWSSAQASNWLSHSIAAQFMYGIVADGILVAGVFAMMRLLHWRLSDI